MITEREKKFLISLLERHVDALEDIASEIELIRVNVETIQRFQRKQRGGGQ